MVNTESRQIIIFAAKDGEALYSQQKNKIKRLGVDCGSDHELLTAKFRLKLNKVGETTRQFRYQFSSVQSLSYVQFFVIPWMPAHQASLSIIYSQSLPKLMSIESVMPSNHSSSVVHFFSCPQSFPGSVSIQMSQLFESGGQIIGVSATTSVLPKNT